MLLLEEVEEEDKVENEDKDRRRGRGRRHAGARCRCAPVQCSPGRRCKSAQPEWEWDGELGMEMRWDGMGMFEMASQARSSHRIRSSQVERGLVVQTTTLQSTRCSPQILMSN